MQAPLTGALICTEVAVSPDEVLAELGALVVGAATVGAEAADDDAWPAEGSRGEIDDGL